MKLFVEIVKEQKNFQITMDKSKKMMYNIKVYDIFYSMEDIKK